MEQSKSSPLKALNVMVEAETTVAEFYRLCSEKFSEHFTFWDSLALGELAHAEVIRKLIELVKIHREEFTAGTPAPLDTINLFISRTKSNIDKLRHSDLPEEKALIMAYHIENTFIELKYAQVVTTENEQYKALLDQVIAETLKHKEKVVAKTKDHKEAAKLRRKPS